MAYMFISNNPAIQDYEGYMSIDDFLAAVSSDEGLDTPEDFEGIFIDVEGFDSDYYHPLKEAFGGHLQMFTLNPDEIPNWIVEEEIEISDLRESFGLDSEDSSQIVENEVVEEIEEPPAAQDEEEIPNEENNDLVAEAEELSRPPVYVDNIQNLFNSAATPVEGVTEETDNKEAECYVFGSSKGGSGKTFTAVLSARQYAKEHPHEKVALADFDILDGQIGITIHKLGPTMYDFYANNWSKGEKNFKGMSPYKVKSDKFPSNLDFYLAPKDVEIDNDEFWNDVFKNLITNYDRVYFDTGISYMTYKPISTLYKIADKVILTSSTSIKSVSSVKKQISKLKGINKNKVFKEEDEIGKVLNLVITQAVVGSATYKTVIQTFKNDVNILGVFGYMTDEIEKAEYLEQWNVFDNMKEVLQIVSKINA